MLFKDADISKISSVSTLSKNCIIELQNHRNVVWKGPLKALESTPLPEAQLLLVPEQVGHDFVQSSPDKLQAWGHHNLSSQSVLHGTSYDFFPL